MNVIIWLIIIYIITIILLGVAFYCDMDKGESLEHYFKGMDTMLFIVVFLLPIFNTCILIMLIFDFLLKKIWNKIKHWKK